MEKLMKKAGCLMYQSNYYCHSNSSHSSPQKAVTTNRGDKPSLGLASAGLISMGSWPVPLPSFCEQSQQKRRPDKLRLVLQAMTSVCWLFSSLDVWHGTLVPWTWTRLEIYSSLIECFRQLSFSFSGFWLSPILWVGYGPTMHSSASFWCLDITNPRRPNLRIIFCSYLPRLFLLCLRYYLNSLGIMTDLGPSIITHMELSREFCYKQHTVRGNLKNLCKYPFGGG